MSENIRKGRNLAVMNPYDMNPDFFQTPDGLYPEMEKKANNVKTLGIVSLVASIAMACCCTVVGPAIAVTGLVKANNLKPYLQMLSPNAQKNLKNGQMFCMIALVISVIAIISNIAVSRSPYMQEFYEQYAQQMQEAMQQAQQSGTV